MIGMSALAAVVLAVNGPPPVAKTADVIAIVHVDVIPMDTEGILRDHTVVVRGDRIVALGPAAGTSLPDGAMVIDGRGKAFFFVRFDLFFS